MKITGKIIDQVSTAIKDGKFKVDDDKKAIVSCLDGRVVEALSVNKKGLTNVQYTANKKSANALYSAYKKSKSIKNRTVTILPDNAGASKNNSIKKNSRNAVKRGVGKVYQLIRDINNLILGIQAKGVASTGKAQSKVIQDLEGIKLHAGDALRNTSPHLTTKNIVDAKTEISKRGGDKLTEDTTSLSDPNRSVKLNEQISELYSNEWTNLLEDLGYDMNDKKGEKEIVTILYQSLLITYDVCKKNKKLTSDEKEAIILKEIKKTFGAIKSGKALNDYVKQSTHICTHMLKYKNPLVFGEPPRSGSEINKEEYKEYNSAGNKVDYPAWPPVYLYKGGPLVSKGVVEPLPLRNKNIADVTKKTKTVFKETDEKVIDLIKRTEEAEKTVVNVGNGGAYKYSEANLGGMNLRSRLNYWTKRLDDARTEISKRGGDKLTEDNPIISDLSDRNRPDKLSAQILELYGNEWTDLLEDLGYDMNDKNGEKKIVTILYKSLLMAYDVCKKNKKLTSDEKEAIIVKEIKKTFGAVKSGKALNDYVKQSTHICTHMLKYKNPLVFGEPPRSGSEINKEEYKEYNRAGNKVDYPAWPPVYLYKGGPLMSKGVVEPLPPKKKNTVDVTKKFKETNEEVIDLIKKVEATEKRIVSMSGVYEYLQPNPGNADLNSRVGYWKKRSNDALNALSKLSGEKLRKNNPEITDLSDPNRPIKLGDRMNEIYDNQWTDAMDEIGETNSNVNEKLVATILHEIIMDTYEICKNNQQLTNDDKGAMVLKEIKNKYNSVKFGKVTNIYIKDCTNVCTHMVKQDVPVFFGKSLERGSDIDTEVYREFTVSGDKVDYRVWPPIFLYEGGPLLSKGIVQPIKVR